MLTNKIKVLIADDSVTIRKVLKNSLANFDITDCDDAPDGQEAWNAINNTKYDIIFIDYNMPKINGLALARKIFECKTKFEQMRIVAVSSVFTKDLIKEFKSVGVGTFITKPFGIDMLRAAIEPTLRREINPISVAETTVSLPQIQALFNSYEKREATYDGKFILLNFGEKTLAMDADKVLKTSKIRSLATNKTLENTTKALIADDSAMIRNVIKNSLEGFNITDCDEATDGNMALDMLNGAKTYDMVFLDYNMPQLNGLELALKIFERKSKFTNIKVVAVSSSFSKELITQFKSIGVRTFIKKPFRPEMFKAAVGPILAYGADNSEEFSLSDIANFLKFGSRKIDCDYNYITLNFAKEALMIELDAILTASYIYAN